MSASREIRLKSRPVGMPEPDNFELVAVELPAPGAGHVQVRNRWLSVDPYMRMRMNADKGYMPRFEVGKALEGAAVGEVIVSNDPSLRPGDTVSSVFGWREAFNAPAAEVRKLDIRGVPPQAVLGVTGLIGLTAYVGLLRIAALKGGETVFVSAAAGAVGSIACQIAKIKGCMVIGSAGGAEKVAYLKSIGVDHTIDYKAEPDLTAALAKAAPDGIDVYFDNVGGAHLEAALNAAKESARIAVCGMISHYNTVNAGPGNLFLLVAKSIRMEGFLVRNHADMADQCQTDILAWITDGRLQWHETVEQGLDNTVRAFLKLFDGTNLGKMLVKLD